MDRRAFVASIASLVAAPAGVVPGAPDPGAPDPSASATAAFAAWREAFKAKAPALGLPADRVAAVLDPLAPDPSVLALDTRQPEFTKPVSAYLSSAAGPERVAEGRERMDAAAPWLSPLAAAYGTGPEVLVAIWGVETSYGRVLGDDDVIRSMATLAAAGRRRDFAESELVGAFRILLSGEARREELRGSWAGAMGQTQFTPIDYLDYAVDADGDGRRDVWRSAPDALGSTANFLVRKAAWRPGGSAQVEVVTPAEGFDWTLVDGPELTPAHWGALGVTPAPGAAFRPPDLASGAALIAPMGWRGPIFLTFPNHRAIKVYNNSTSYALAVGLLAARVGGAPELFRPWPADAPISIADRIAAQRALKAQGLYSGPEDGLFGAATREAARLWQARRGLPPDGYLSSDLVQRLKTEAPLVS